MPKIAKLKIIYQENCKDSDIKIIISEIYSKNKNYISGMTYVEYKNEEDYKKEESKVQELKDTIDKLKITNFLLRSSSILKNGKDIHTLIMEKEKLQNFLNGWKERAEKSESEVQELKDTIKQLRLENTNWLYVSQQNDKIIEKLQKENETLKNIIEQKSKTSLGNDINNLIKDKNKEIESLKNENHLMGCMIKELELRLKKSEDMLANVSSQLSTKDHEWEQKINKILEFMKTVATCDEATMKIFKKLLIEKRTD